jgi:opacity protein-like surface antigen
VITMRARNVWLATVFACATLVGAPAWAQPPGLPLGAPTPPPGTEAPRRAPITVTPFIAITGEYNDNVFQTNANKVDDFIFAFTPGISIAIENPIYSLIGSYSFTSEIYVDQEQLNDALARQNLRLDGSYRVTPRLTLSLSETFVMANDSNLVVAENVSTGRTTSMSNILSPALAYQIDPRTTLRLRGTWTLVRYDTGTAIDTDTYAAEAFVDYAFTPRLTGTAGYQFSYFAIEDTDDAVTHTPRVGLTYRFTPTLTGSLSGGPSILVPENGDTEVFPAVTAALQQRWSWGSGTVQYDHAIGTAGGLGGPTEDQVFGATLQVDRLVRGLILQLVPRYTRTRGTSGTTTGNIDVDTFSVTLQGRYEITRWMAAIAGYTFYAQRSGNTTVVTPTGTIVTANDIDQNRVFVGLQFGYPITFD